MADFFSNVWATIVSFFGSYHLLRDTIDIALVAFVIYSVIKLVRDSRAEQLLKGILIFALAFLTSSLLDLKTMHYLLQTVFDNILIVLIIIFQPEIRRALEQVGHSRLSNINIFGMREEEAEEETKRWQKAISATCAAVETLQRQKMGALIVFERNTKLGEIINTGTVVDADPTPELIGNIFFNKAPLHDGAMIMRDGKVYAAGCILPLTDNLQISSELGTRHRAGVGMSENSDALVVIVSEETGTVSMAVGGELKRNFSSEALRVALENGILWDRAHKEKDGERKPIGPFRRKKKSDK
ncbi:MAG TPA: diadenylate cyclase CdaA [Firmicutes bacterium]|nr:diadenylate cyclase CdaA [Bacillota bacterium]